MDMVEKMARAHWDRINEPKWVIISPYMRKMEIANMRAALAVLPDHIREQIEEL